MTWDPTGAVSVHIEDIRKFPWLFLSIYSRSRGASCALTTPRYTCWSVSSHPGDLCSLPLSCWSSPCTQWEVSLPEQAPPQLVGTLVYFTTNFGYIYTFVWNPNGEDFSGWPLTAPAPHTMPVCTPACTEPAPWPPALPRIQPHQATYRRILLA